MTDGDHREAAGRFVLFHQKSVVIGGVGLSLDFICSPILSPSFKIPEIQAANAAAQQKPKRQN